MSNASNVPWNMPDLIRVRSLPEGWDVMVDSGDGNGIHHFPYMIKDVRTGPISRREMPTIVVTLIAHRVEVEHEHGSPHRADAV
jgi:hypothetical protein